MDNNARLEEEINLLKTNLNCNKVELESIRKPCTKTGRLLIAIDLHGLNAISATELLEKYRKVDHLLKHTPRVRFITGTARTRPTPPVLRPLVLSFLKEHYVAVGREISESDGHIDLCLKQNKQKQRPAKNSNGPDDEKENRVVVTVKPNENKKAEHSIIEVIPDSKTKSDGHAPKNQKKQKQQRRDKNGNDKNNQQKGRHEPNNKKNNQHRTVVEPEETEKAEHCIIEIPPDSVVVELDDTKKQNDETNIAKQEDNWVYYIAHRIYETYASVMTAFYKRSTSLCKRSTSFCKKFFSRH